MKPTEMDGGPFIPFHRPSIGSEEIDAVERVLASRWLTTGPVTLEFEREFAAYLGCKHALAVSSATAALELALASIGLREGDEVLVPTYTFTASAAVAVHLGAVPLLCDSVPDGFNIDVTDAESRITDKTRAIMPVHIAGEPCDMQAIQTLAERYKLHIIEDAAHALPASYRGKRIGAVSDLTAFSFYATKTITTAEGGMLTTDDDALAAYVSRMRLHGIRSDAWKRYSREGSWYYEVEDAGYKANMPDLLAALGRAQLQKCDQLWRARCEIAEQYTMAFTNLVEVEVPPPSAPGDQHAWHLYILRLRPELLNTDRNEVIELLKRAGIGTSVHFIPLHRHPFYRHRYGVEPGEFPNAEDAYLRCISLPIFPDLSEAERERVISAVTQIVTQRRIRRIVAA